MKPLFQNIVIEEERVEEEDEVHGLEDKGSTPFLTRAAYERSLSRGTAREFVVPVEQQAHQQMQSAAGPIILEDLKPKASPYSHDYGDLQIYQPIVIPSLVIKKCEVSSPSSYASSSVQKTSPHDFPLGTGVGQNSMPKADMDNLSLDIPKPAQLASTQLERAVYQITEEEDARFLDTSLDVDCSKKDVGADEVFMSPAQEYIGSPFIVIVKATNGSDKCTTIIVV